MLHYRDYTFGKREGLSIVKQKIVHVIVVALALVLAILPFGVNGFYTTSASADAVSYEQIESFSFFDLRAIPYVGLAPFVTACLIVVLLFFVIVSFFVKERWMAITLWIVSLLTLATALSPLLNVTGWEVWLWEWDFEIYSATALTVLYLLMCSLLISIQAAVVGKPFLSYKKPPKE